MKKEERELLLPFPKRTDESLNRQKQLLEQSEKHADAMDRLWCWVGYPMIVLTMLSVLVVMTMVTKIAIWGVPMPCPHCKEVIRKTVTVTYTEIPAVNNEAMDMPTEMTVSQ